MKDSVVECAKTVFRVIKEYIIKYYVAFFCGGVVWMLLDVYVTKGIDSSFVSAVMDTIMAGTAILAVLAAKNYLAQFTAQEGFKIAISLVNDEMMTLDRHYVVLDNYLKLYDQIHDFDRKTISRDMGPTLTELQKKLTSSSVELNALYNRMLEKKRKLDTYGIVIQNSKTQFYIDMISNLSMFLVKCKILETKTIDMRKSIEFLYKDGLNKISKHSFHLNRYKFEDEVANSIDTNQLWLSIINNNTKFREIGGRSITKLFKVNG